MGKEKKNKTKNQEKKEKISFKEKLKQEVLLKENRVFYLIISVLIGLYIAVIFFKSSIIERIQIFIFSIESNQDLKLNFTIFITIVALPMTFYLWFLRNHDKLEQLEKTKENNNFNNFSSAMKLFTEKDNLEANCIGLKLLAELRRKKLYVKQIDLVTPYKDLSSEKLKEGLLQRANLQGADLQGMKLRGVNLQKANLQGANLREADLYRVILKEARLEGANLKDANLELASLEESNLVKSNLQGVNLEGASLYKAFLLGTFLYGSNLQVSNLQALTLEQLILYINEKRRNIKFTKEELIHFLRNYYYREYKETKNYNKFINVKTIKNNDTYTFQELEK